MHNDLNNNSVSLAGEFAVLSQLTLRGYDASLTLGRTKSIDILVSHPSSEKMCRLEVKTNYHYKISRSPGGTSTLFGRYVSLWQMNEKHEKITDTKLFYCFVNINKNDHGGYDNRYFIVPSRIVAQYVQSENALWLKDNASHKNTPRRTFRIGTQDGEYRIPTPTHQEYENNWDQLKQ